MFAAVTQSVVNMPEVSVIIPNYNHAQYLRQRIDSVLAQTFRDFEIIILDDHSSDNSRDVIESYRGNEYISKVIYNDANSGSPFSQWQKGIAEASGRWLWIAESDDYAEPAFLSTLLKLANEHPQTGIAFCASNWVDDKGETGPDLSVHKRSFCKTGSEEIRKYLCRQCTIQNASSAIIRRDLAAKAIQGLSAYRACGDWIFYTRILHHADIAFTGKKLNHFRWYHNNTSNKAKTGGVWLKEGIHVLDNIDLKKVKFTLLEFTKMIKYWQGVIRRAVGGNKKEWAILANFTARYFKLQPAKK